MSTSIRIYPGEEQLQPWLETVADRFETGTLLYSGRNEVRLFHVEGRLLVVKRFKRHNWLKRTVYTYLRKNKARRAFENAMELARRGFSTPRAVACIEVRRQGMLQQVYYVSEHTGAQPIRPRLIEQAPFDRPLAEAYARFVARLHEGGVLHRDLNPTNVLYTKDEGGDYHFELIDINRMEFYDGPVPKTECMENLTLFWWLSDVYRYVLGVYAAARGWTSADVAQAIRVKQGHDRRWVLRKRITHPFSYKPSNNKTA